MSDEREFSVRRAATQVQRAGFNAGMVKFLAFEAMTSAVVAGIHFKSWTWGLGVFFGVLLLFSVEGVKPILAGIYSIAWAVIAYMVVGAIAPTERVAPFIAGVAGLLMALAAHQCFFQWQKDFQ